MHITDSEGNPLFIFLHGIRPNNRNIIKVKGYIINRKNKACTDRSGGTIRETLKDSETKVKTFLKCLKRIEFHNSENIRNSNDPLG